MNLVCDAERREVKKVEDLRSDSLRTSHSRPALPTVPKERENPRPETTGCGTRGNSKKGGLKPPLQRVRIQVTTAESFTTNCSVSYASSSSMLRLNKKSLPSARLIGAWLCLVAVALLWMPVVAAAWGAHVMACCDGKICTTQGHQHNKQTQKPANGTGAPMNCEHAKGEPQSDSMMNCAMSCCQQQEQFTSVGVVYVLPEAAAQNIFLTAERSVLPADARQMSVRCGPLSPPPRSNTPVV